jgi:hypothetical protein
MRRSLVIYPIPLNFLIYEENFLFFFISVHYIEQTIQKGSSDFNATYNTLGV